MTNGEQIMMAEGSNNVQDREKVTKKKSRKTLSKKDAHNSPEHKVAKRSPKKARSRKDIHSPSDTIRQSQPQKCLQQTHRSSSCLKERNVVAQPGNNQPGWNYSIKTPSKIHQVTMREPIQVDLLKDRYIPLFNDNSMHTGESTITSDVKNILQLNNLMVNFAHY